MSITSTVPSKSLSMIGHVRFCKAYKDMRLTVTSLVIKDHWSCVNMLLTLLYLLQSARVHLAALLCILRYQILDIIGKSPKYQIHTQGMALQE